MRFLLDTNVISELRKPKCDAHVLAWSKTHDPTTLCISVLVLGEVRRGIERLATRDPEQGVVLERWLQALHAKWAGRVLPVTVEIAEEWGRFDGRSPIPTVDGLLAATALVHKLTLVTRNTRDVARTGVSVLNPFEPVEPA